jgi:hypothetical protein
MDSGQTKEQVLAEAQSYRIIDAPTEAIRLNLIYYKKSIHDSCNCINTT